MVAVAGARPKLTTTTPLALNIVAKTATEDGTKILVRYVIEDIDLDSFVVSADTTTSDPNLVTTGDGFAAVRVGDEVSGAGIPVGAYVLSKTDDNNITLDQNATATASGVSITFNSTKTIDGTLYLIEVDNVLPATGSTLTTTITYYSYDGSAVADADNDDDDEVTPSEASDTKVLGNRTHDLDAYLTAARQAATN